MTTSSSASGAVTEILNKECVVSLHSGCRRCVAVTHRAVDHVKACLPLIQPQLEVGTTTPREVLRAPLNVEDAVGRSATDRGEDAEPAIDQIQVVPIRVDRVVVSEPRQALVGEVRISSCELRVAVGRQIDAGKALVVQSVREWQSHRGHRIIPVIADVCRARNDAAADLTEHVRADARRRR